MELLSFLSQYPRAEHTWNAVKCASSYHLSMYIVQCGQVRVITFRVGINNRKSWLVSVVSEICSCRGPDVRIVFSKSFMCHWERFLFWYWAQKVLLHLILLTIVLCICQTVLIGCWQVLLKLLVSHMMWYIPFSMYDCVCMCLHVFALIYCYISHMIQIKL